MNRRQFIASAAALAATAAVPAFADAYPERLLKLLVPFPPGGGTDTAARIVMKKLSEQLGQPIVVENRAGAGGAVAYNELLRNKPDGYTLTISSGHRSLMNLMNGNLQFNAATDIVPVAPMAYVPIALITGKALPVSNMAEFIAYARKNPGLQFGTPGPTTPNHMAGMLLGAAIGAELVHVGYKGTAPAVQDVIGGHLPAAIVGLSTAIQFGKTGQVKVLGVGSARRSELAPDIPTIAEGGVKGYDAGYWYDISVGKGTPQAIIDRLHAEITKAVQSPEVRQTLAAGGFEPMVATEAEYRRLLQAEHAKWEPVVKVNNIKVD